MRERLIRWFLLILCVRQTFEPTHLNSTLSASTFVFHQKVRKKKHCPISIRSVSTHPKQQPHSIHIPVELSAWLRTRLVMQLDGFPSETVLVLPKWADRRPDRQIRPAQKAHLSISSCDAKIDNDIVSLRPSNGSHLHSDRISHQLMHATLILSSEERLDCSTG